MRDYKFTRLESSDWVPHDYGNLYFRNSCGESERLVIGPSSGHVHLLATLAAELRGQPWYILYVLLVPRLGNRSAGRYQSPPFDTLAELRSFLSSFTSYFEGDGRHHIWIGSAGNDGLLVYDQHNVIFAYGPIDRFERLLQARGYRQEEFWFPAPHAHSYAAENDGEEERLMAAAEWQYFPLESGDEWD